MSVRQTAYNHVSLGQTVPTLTLTKLFQHTLWANCSSAQFTKLSCELFLRPVCIQQSIVSQQSLLATVCTLTLLLSLKCPNDQFYTTDKLFLCSLCHYGHRGSYSHNDTSTSAWAEWMHSFLYCWRGEPSVSIT